MRHAGWENSNTGSIMACTWPHGCSPGPLHKRCMRSFRRCSAPHAYPSPAQCTPYFARRTPQTQIGLRRAPRTARSLPPACQCQPARRAHGTPQCFPLLSSVRSMDAGPAMQLGCHAGCTWRVRPPRQVRKVWPIGMATLNSASAGTPSNLAPVPELAAPAAPPVLPECPYPCPLPLPVLGPA